MERKKARKGGSLISRVALAWSIGGRCAVELPSLGKGSPPLSAPLLMIASLGLWP